MRAIINLLFDKDRAEIWLREESSIIGYDGENLVKVDVEPFNVPPQAAIPLLRLPLSLFNPILKAVITAVQNKGIETENENLLKGKLEATKLHLEDMRELAKMVINKQLG